MFISCFQHIIDSKNKHTYKILICFESKSNSSGLIVRLSFFDTTSNRGYISRDIQNGGLDIYSKMIQIRSLGNLQTVLALLSPLLDLLMGNYRMTQAWEMGIVILVVSAFL
jgi:hypothetical protein